MSRAGASLGFILMARDERAGDSHVSEHVADKARGDGKRIVGEERRLYLTGSLENRIRKEKTCCLDELVEK